MNEELSKYNRMSSLEDGLKTLAQVAISKLWLLDKIEETFQEKRAKGTLTVDELYSFFAAERKHQLQFLDPKKVASVKKEFH